MSETRLVKRKGSKEAFDERKLYASVYWACRSAHLHEKKAESLAEQVCKKAEKWLKPKSQISAEELFSFVITELETLNQKAAFMYRTHQEAI